MTAALCESLTVSQGPPTPPYFSGKFLVFMEIGDGRLSNVLISMWLMGKVFKANELWTLALASQSYGRCHVMIVRQLGAQPANGWSTEGADDTADSLEEKETGLDTCGGEALTRASPSPRSQNQDLGHPAAG